MMALYISYSKKRVQNRNLVFLLLSLLKAAGVEKQQILDMRTTCLRNKNTVPSGCSDIV